MVITRMRSTSTIALLSTLLVVLPMTSAFVSRGGKTKRNHCQTLWSMNTQGQENLTSRAFVEESFLKENQTVLEMASEEERAIASKSIKKQMKENKKKERGATTGGSGGFGGIASSKTMKKPKGHFVFNAKVDKQGFGSIVLDQGVARINGCLSESTASKLLSFINQQLEYSIKEVDDGTYPPLFRFADVLAKKHRWDMLLPLDESSSSEENKRSNVVLQGLSELLFEKDSIVGDVIESILGKDAELYELASLISDPGSDQQVLHSDFPYQDTLPPALTCFVALQNIEPDMGPTTFLPNSATEEHHQDLQDRLWDINSRTGLIAEAPNKLSTLGTGDVSVYNPMTVHCGGANRSEKRRVLFYFSFKNPALNPSTAGASLRPELLERKLTLKSLKDIVKKELDPALV